MPRIGHVLLERRRVCQLHMQGEVPAPGKPERARVLAALQCVHPRYAGQGCQRLAEFWRVCNVAELVQHDVVNHQKNTCSPPVRLSAAPVMKPLSSLASQVASAPMSAGSPRRPTGMLALM